MPHDTPLISTIVAGLVLAFIFGAIANRFKMPPLVGYLIAGVLVGPYTPGFVADAELATELSEIGVILLMFGVGLHFSLKDLLSVGAIAVPGAVVQIGGATLMGVGLSMMMGWSLGAGLVFGLALSVASTVVLLKALQDRRMVDSDRGRIAVGWLIVEDIAMVLALVLIPTMASLLGASEVELHDPFIDFTERMFNIELGIPGVIAITVLKLAAFVGFMLVVGRRVIPMVLHFTAHTGSRELFRLAVLAIALGVAAGAAYLFGVSLALGAFFAGMILSESELSHRAAQESLPLRDAFSVLFFVSVGMLFDPTIILTNPLPVLATLFIILIGKSVLAFLIVLLFRRGVSTALTISASLAQIGEFSFILAALGVGLGILPPEGRDLILAGAIISIVLNPVMFFVLDWLRPRLEMRIHGSVSDADGHRVEPDLGGSPRAPDAAVAVEVAPDVVHPTGLNDHTILVGFGRVGSVVAEGLKAANKPFLVIEDAEGRVAAARASGIEVIVGNAAAGDVLRLANAAGAHTVMIAIPNAFEAGQATEQSRKANPNITIIARAHSDEEEEHLKHLGANEVIMGEREIGHGMVDIVTRDQKAATDISVTDAVAAALGTTVGFRPRTVTPPTPVVEPEPPKRPAPLFGEILPPNAPGPIFGDVPPTPADEPMVGNPPTADQARPIPEIDEAALARAIGAPPAVEPAVEPAPSEPVVEAEPEREVEPVGEEPAPSRRQPARTPGNPFKP